MSETAAIALLVIPAYFLGTFPSAILVARAAGHDVLKEGSGNPGASNVARLVGWKGGVVVLLADFAKGAIAAWVGLIVGGRPGAAVLGLAAVVGHMLPVTRRFKGGKGVATGGGMLAVLFPWIALALAVVWFLIARVLKLASVGSIVVAVLFPILVALAGYDTGEVVLTAAIAVLVIARHQSNLRRLFSGRELRTDHPGGAEPEGESDAA